MTDVAGVTLEKVSDDLHITWYLEGEHWLNFHVFHVKAWDIDDDARPIYGAYRVDGEWQEGPAPLPHLATASGHLRWDGCLQFRFNEEYADPLHFDFHSSEEPWLSRMVKALFALGVNIPSWDYGDKTS